MEEDKKSIDGVLENLALLTDGMQTLFPEGKIICVYELNDVDFKKVQSNFRAIDRMHKRFNIDISGVEHVFVHEEYSNQLIRNKIVEDTETNIDKKDVKISLIRRILSGFKRG